MDTECLHQIISERVLYNFVTKDGLDDFRARVYDFPSSFSKFSSPPWTIEFDGNFDEGLTWKIPEFRESGTVQIIETTEKTSYPELPGDPDDYVYVTEDEITCDFNTMDGIKFVFSS